MTPGKLRFAAVLFADPSTKVGSDARKWFLALGQSSVFLGVGWLDIAGSNEQSGRDKFLRLCLDEVAKKEWPEDVGKLLTAENMPFALFIDRDFNSFDPRIDGWAICRSNFFRSRKGKFFYPFKKIKDQLAVGRNIFEALDSRQRLGIPKDSVVMSGTSLANELKKGGRPLGADYSKAAQWFLAECKAGKMEECFKELQPERAGKRRYKFIKSIASRKIREQIARGGVDSPPKIDTITKQREIRTAYSEAQKYKSKI